MACRRRWRCVNPNQKGCEYPYKQLCGAGVAFKLAQGLMQRRLDAKDQNKLLLSFMKVVAIATIADAVPLTGENRVFASLGLDALRRAVNPGLKALLEVAQISANRPPTSGEVGFRIAPRINAAGRMDVARDVIELFSVKDPARARELAAKLDQLNTDRQEEERRILRAVEERFAGDPALSDAYCIVVDGDGWHRGVIGITATRVVERYNRPTLVISRDGEEAFGSGRSIRAFHLLEAIESCGSLFSRYGGHSHACGFAMPAANVAELRARLDAFARARLTLADFDPVLDLDAELSSDRHYARAVSGAAIAGTLRHGESRARIRGARSAADRASADSQRQARQAETQGGAQISICRDSCTVVRESGRTLRSRDPGDSALPSRRRRDSARRKSGGGRGRLRPRTRSTEN